MLNSERSSLLRSESQLSYLRALRFAGTLRTSSAGMPMVPSSPGTVELNERTRVICSARRPAGLSACLVPVVVTVT